MSTRRKPNPGNPARRARIGVVTDEGIQFAGDRARPSLLDPPAPGVHLWIATAVHAISEESAAAAYNGRRVILDVETLAMLMTGCYVCERPYSPDVASQSCPGEPQ